MLVVCLKLLKFIPSFVLYLTMSFDFILWIIHATSKLDRKTNVYATENQLFSFSRKANWVYYNKFPFKFCLKSVSGEQETKTLVRNWKFTKNTKDVLTNILTA